MNSVTPEFWRGKRVLLTGHTGFKGGWLALWLQTMGAEVSGIALSPTTSPALFDVARVGAGLRHNVIDIRAYESVHACIAAFQPEILFHLAAQPLVRASYQAPLDTYSTNVMGTAHVLEAARHAGSVQSIVNITTDKCYDNREWGWGYRENDPMGGHDPYSNSKACSEFVSSAYRASFLKDAGIALATARAGNVIGGGDWAGDRLVPDILRALELGESVQIRNPHAIRPWQHVLEPLSGYLQLAQHLHTQRQSVAEGWNFGPCDDDARSVQWIVEHICKIWGPNAAWSVQSGAHPHEASHLKLDISKARQRLSWVPRWSLETALAHTIEWHKAWRNGQDMQQVCQQQITQYLADA